MPELPRCALPLKAVWASQRTRVARFRRPGSNHLLAAAACLPLLLSLPGLTPAARRTAPARPSLVQSIKLHAALLFRTVEHGEIWRLNNPSLIAHKLLACGRACTDASGRQLVATWLDGNLDGSSLMWLHRGELAATFAELDLEEQHGVRFRDGSKTSVGDIVRREAVGFALDPTVPWNTREQKTGVEYGFTVRAFCHYLGPDAEVGKESSVHEIVRLMISAPNRNVEAGTHELEGIAECLSQARRVQARDRAGDVYEQAERFLASEAETALNQLAPNGQAYASAPGFYSLEDPDPLGLLMTDLVRQAHLFEWLLRLPEPPGDARVAAALVRLDALLRQISQQFSHAWFAEDGVRQALAISALSHARHVSLMLPGGRQAQSSSLKHAT